MKPLEEKRNQLELIKEERKQVDNKYQKLSGKMYKEIKVIEDKYDSELNDFKSNISGLDDEISSITKEIQQLEIDEEWQEASARPEINEFYLMAMLRKCEIITSSYDILDIKHKQKLKNGIDIWMIINDTLSPYKFYLAFFGEKLIGTSFRETSKHAGDETTPFSFIGQFKQLLKTVKTNEFTEQEWKANATFQEWIRELKKLSDKTFMPMPMNDETLESIKTGINEYWSYYGWKKEEEITE